MITIFPSTIISTSFLFFSFFFPPFFVSLPSLPSLPFFLLLHSSLVALSCYVHYLPMNCPDCPNFCMFSPT